MELKRVVITGLGTLTPIGNNVSQFWDALLRGVSGASLITKFDTTNFKCKIAAEVKNGTISIDDITEKTVSDHLYLPEVPDPDLLIRTSGEERVSNFLLWQISYSEFYFTKTLWPDFDINEFDKAVQAYYGRKRRFGGR